MSGMRIVDLTPDNVDESISLCIGSKPGFEQAREEKRRWLEGRLPTRVGAKLAYDDDSLAGMLEYSPIEYTPFPVVGNNLLHIHCLWILPRFQKKGLAKELMKSLVRQAEKQGRRGISVVAHDTTFFMPVSFFTNNKFRTVDRRNNSQLMWRELTETSVSDPPRFVSTSFTPTTAANKVGVDVLYCSQCPWTIKSRERMARVTKEFGKEIKTRMVRTDDRKVMEDIGEISGVFVDGQHFYFASTEEDIRRMLAAKVRELHRPVKPTQAVQVKSAAK